MFRWWKCFLCCSLVLLLWWPWHRQHQRTPRLTRTIQRSLTSANTPQPATTARSKWRMWDAAISNTNNISRYIVFTAGYCLLHRPDPLSRVCGSTHLCLQVSCRYIVITALYKLTHGIYNIYNIMHYELSFMMTQYWMRRYCSACLCEIIASEMEPGLASSLCPVCPDLDVCQSNSTLLL